MIDEIWCVIFEQIDNYDCSKSSLTTFVLPWIRHVVTEYCSRNFHKTTSYYADGIRKVSAAMNYCQEKNIPSSIETLQKLTGLRIPTIKKCIDLLSNLCWYRSRKQQGYDKQPGYELVHKTGRACGSLFFFHYHSFILILEYPIICKCEKNEKK